jgi:hypothetical protein
MTRRQRIPGPALSSGRGRGHLRRQDERHNHQGHATSGSPLAALGNKAISRLVESGQIPPRQLRRSEAPGSGPGNQRVQRLFGLGKKKKKKTEETAPVQGPMTERQAFESQVFKMEDFVPATKIGKFDAVYRPKDGVMDIISRVHFTFEDVPPEYKVEVENKKDLKWTKQQKKDWTKNWIESVLVKWGDIEPFTCDKPGYEDLVVKPNIKVDVVDDPSKAQYKLKVGKAYQKKGGGMKTGGGTSGVTREGGGGFQEQDVYDKINNPKVKQHLADAENRGNILPAFNRDQERMRADLAKLAPIKFKWDMDVFDGDGAARARAAADAILKLRDYSALSDLHPIDVHVVLDKDEPKVLLLDRFTKIKEILQAAGVNNSLSAKRGTAGPGRTASLVAAPNSDYVKEQYLQKWDRYTSAHEFGHILGLLDEYCPAVSPDLIAQMFSEGQITEDEKTISESAKGKIGSFKDQQSGYADLLKKTGLSVQNWSRPSSSSAGERSTSLMSGGFEMFRQHHVTMWEALTVLTKDHIESNHWKV